MAAGGTSTTTLASILKIRYPQKKLASMNYADAAMLGMVGRDESFGGKQTNIAVNYGRSQGSMLFATAQTNASSDDDVAFAVTRAKDYHVCTMSAEAILAAKGNADSIINGLDRAMENAKLSFKRSISTQLFRNGGGARGQVAAGGLTTATLTLTEANDAVFFETNMYLHASTADGTSGAIRTGTERIAGVNRGATTATLTSTSASWDAVITAIAANDYLFRAGDFGIAAKGLDAWLPGTAPTSGDSFFGVDRSVDPVRLAGCRYAATAGSSKEDTLIDAAAYLGREGGTPDTVFCHNSDRRDIIKNLGSKVIYDKTKSATDASFSFKSVALETDGGTLQVVPDPNCPKGVFYMLDMSTWKIGSLKGVPHYADDDSNNMLRQSAADGIEWRLRAFWQLYTDAPGKNLRGTF